MPQRGEVLRDVKVPIFEVQDVYELESAKRCKVLERRREPKVHGREVVRGAAEAERGEGRRIREDGGEKRRMNLCSEGWNFVAEVLNSWDDPLIV